MKTLNGPDLMKMMGAALRGEKCAIITQTPDAAHYAIQRLLRGWKMRGTLSEGVWTVEGMLPGVSGSIAVRSQP